MNRWKDTDHHEEVYEYGGFLITHHRLIESGTPAKHKMKCEKDYIYKMEKKSIHLEAGGASFREAKRNIIDKIDDFNNSQNEWRPLLD
ncbi:hypothetical protein NC796_04795 [Aliifodinibius sp. S!AR15-10]|uniref:hypothetical protein n=1 Tax=Aliifodinibius sp. S!AR15-10 TaxID=2950437 RepID=UPI002857E0C6|nr:hypothetical protein [Aliifodinibius sp. S!AR15-10]MDR8390448.1 hypothetical protein [Aliifodinibius sp. S!AR15-10]